MKTKTLAIVMVLIGSFVLAPSLLRADQDQWYQGRKGQWVQHQNAWQFRDLDGNEYRNSGNAWGWFRGATPYNDWYQGRQGQWIQRQNAWQFRDMDGNEYRQHGNSWAWYNGRHHSEEGAAYHNRPAGNNQTYDQYKNTH